MAMQTKRNIVVYFFVDSTRSAVIAGSTRWYVYARAANQKAYDALIQNIYGAGVAVVYDDDIGKDLYVITRNFDGEVTTVYDHAIVTSKKYSGTSADKFGDFTRKLAKRAKTRLQKEFLGLPRRNKLRK